MKNNKSSTLSSFLMNYITLILYGSIICCIGDFLTDCREWLTWLDKLKWLLTFRLTGLFRAHCASFHIYSFLLDFFSFNFVLFQSCCSHAQVFGRTLAHEFLFSYSHTEWNLIFQKKKTYDMRLHGINPKPQ